MDALNQAAPAGHQDMMVEPPQNTAAIEACCVYEVLIKLMIGEAGGHLQQYGSCKLVHGILPAGVTELRCRPERC